jgi:hypothetical protein
MASWSIRRNLSAAAVPWQSAVPPALKILFLPELAVLFAESVELGSLPAGDEPSAHRSRLAPVNAGLQDSTGQAAGGNPKRLGDGSLIMSPSVVVKVLYTKKGDDTTYSNLF